MQKDAQGTLLAVLKRIKDIAPEKQAGLLTTLFGSESVGAIAPLLTNLDLLEKQPKKGNRPEAIQWIDGQGVRSQGGNHCEQPAVNAQRGGRRGTRYR